MIDHAPPARAEAASASDFRIEDLAELVSGMSRFLMILMRSKAFATAAIGLTEWAALSALAKDGPMSEAKLGQSVGLPRPMAKALAETLARAELVSIEDGGKSRTVRLIERGTAVLTETNTLLRAQLSGPAPRQRRAIATANRLVNRRLVRELRQSRALGRNGDAPRARMKGKRVAG